MKKLLNSYLVTLTLKIGCYEKTSYSVVKAENENYAGVIALEGECHNDPDFSESPNKDSCWDGGEFIYEVDSVKKLTNNEYSILSKLNIR